MFFPQALGIWKEQNLCRPYLKIYIQFYFQILILSVDFGSSFFRASIEQGECVWKGGKEIIKPSCAHAPPPVHDVVWCLLFFSGGVAHPHTCFELYLLFIQRQKQVKVTGTLSGLNTGESNLYWGKVHEMFKCLSFFFSLLYIIFLFLFLLWQTGHDG